MQLRIQYPEPSDAATVCELYARTWRATYPNQEHGITVADIEQRTEDMVRPERVERFRENLAKHADNTRRFFRVAKLGEKVVGVCGGVEEDAVVHMASLYVAPEHQGAGIGGTLMKAFLAWANPHKPCRINVVTYNHPAIAFYAHWGFTDTGERFTEERFRMASGNTLPEMVMVRPVAPSSIGKE